MPYYGKSTVPGLPPLKSLVDATSSGTEGRRFVLDGAYSQFSVQCGFVSSSQANAGTSAILVGSIATSSDALGTTLLTWTTDDMVVNFESSAQPVTQVWLELDVNTSSGAVNGWITASP